VGLGVARLVAAGRARPGGERWQRLPCQLLQFGVGARGPVGSRVAPTAEARHWYTRLWSLALLTLEIAKHRGPRDPIFLHQRRDRHAAAVFIPEGADLARG
jgi:hypothetical protein